MMYENTATFENTNWQADGNCAIPALGGPVTREIQKRMAREVDAALFPEIPRGPVPAGAPDPFAAGRALCADCPVARRCLQEALDNKIMDGVWGGTTPAERLMLLGHGREDDSGNPVLFTLVTDTFAPSPTELGETPEWGKRSGHGIVSQYNKGCRCDDCKAGSRAYRQEQARRRKDRGIPVRSEEADARRKAARKAKYQALRAAGLSAEEASRAS